MGRSCRRWGGAHPYEYFAESIINPNAVINHDAKEKGYTGPDGKSKMPDYNETFTVTSTRRSHRLSDLTQSGRRSQALTGRTRIVLPQRRKGAKFGKGLVVISTDGRNLS